MHCASLFISYEMNLSDPAPGTHTRNTHTAWGWGYVHMPLLQPCFLSFRTNIWFNSLKTTTYQYTRIDWHHKLLHPPLPGASVQFPVQVGHLCPACPQDRSVCFVPLCVLIKIKYVSWNQLKVKKYTMYCLKINWAYFVWNKKLYARYLLVSASTKLQVCESIDAAVK